MPHAGAVVVTDDFSDNNDTVNPTWIHLNNAAGSTNQTWDASGGKYRLHDPTTSTFGSTLPGLEGYGFVGSYVEPTFTDVRVTVDIVGADAASACVDRITQLNPPVDWTIGSASRRIAYYRRYGSRTTESRQIQTLRCSYSY